MINENEKIIIFLKFFFKFISSKLFDIKLSLKKKRLMNHFDIYFRQIDAIIRIQSNHYYSLRIKDDDVHP